jgi:hypothetical protein
MQVPNKLRNTACRLGTTIIPLITIRRPWVMESEGSRPSTQKRVIWPNYVPTSLPSWKPMYLKYIFNIGGTR